MVWKEFTASDTSSNMDDAFRMEGHHSTQFSERLLVSSAPF